MKKRIVIILVILFLLSGTAYVTISKNSKSSEINRPNINDKNNNSKEETKVIEESKNDIPSKEEPKSEEPKKEETKTETPKIEERKDPVVTPPVVEKKDPVVVEKTMKEQNMEIINNIYKTYGFNIKYGDGTYCYYGYSSCVPLYDDTKANKTLNEISNELTKYPANFFYKFQGENGYRMELMDDIPGDVAGLADYEIGDDNRILIDVNTSFNSRVFSHETWHLIEKLMIYKNNWNNPFDSYWNSMNPDGFVYNDDGGMDYTGYDPDKRYYFVTPYAKSKPQEDRAETFADLMFRPYKREYMASGTMINEKAKKIALEIRKIWGASSNNTWERWISW